ncbi:glycosyltransferase [bacterium]|nr:glycosyltransferase [bacterium]
MTPSPYRPLVTVILPVHNRAWCIARAIRSVFSQDYRPLELIVVDDGSTDATPKVIEKTLADLGNSPRTPESQILRQENQGVSGARNTAIRAGRGKMVALLDSDDSWEPSKTSRQIGQLSARPDLMLNQTDEIWIRDGVQVNRPRHLLKSEGDLFRQCLDHCAVSPSAVMMRRELLDEIGLFDESYPACEDYEMWLRATSRYEVGLIPEPLLIKYGGHEDQLSRTVLALDRYRIRAICKLLDSAKLSGEQRSLALEELRRKCRIYAQGCEKRGRADEAGEIRALPGRYD